MKKFNFYDKLKRKAFKKQELKLILYKTILKTSKIHPLYKLKVQKSLTFFKLKNVCSHSFRNRGVLRSYGMSRIVLKKFVNKGLIPGVQQAC